MIRIQGDFMPPSGFSQKAINGLLIFVEACYEDLLQEIKMARKLKVRQ